MAGDVLKTTNGGSNWLIVNSGTTKDLMYICLTDNITGFICGQIYGGVILKTTNTGNNWRIVFDQNDVSTNFRSICFPTTNIGYAIGNRVFKTTDIGESWFQQITPNLESLNSVYFTNANTGYVVGTNGTIFKTTDGGGPIGIKPISNKIPANFVLYQNYPNPFNPTTKIKYSIPSNVKSETSNVKLIIYDILGREVETLVNEKLQPGTYEVEWSATGGGSNYASGVYFYKLTASDPESSSGLYFVQSRKMVLVK